MEEDVVSATGRTPLADNLVSETAITAIDKVVGDGQSPGAASLDRLELPVIEREIYAIERELARGGLGRILRGRDRRLDRPVAIKELIVTSEQAAARFAREALVSARLQHPAIVPVYEAGRWPSGDPFYTMKMISGRSFKELIDEAKSLDERLALLPHVLAVADAMAYAHEQRVIHRDLKPTNILVGRFGETVVIDWGLAKDLSCPEPDETCEPSLDSPYRLATHDLTMEGAVLGTPQYMPPEQARGEPVDERADVYALGVLLFHLLTGKPPYHGSDPLEVLDQVQAGPPAALGGAWQRGIPMDLQTIVRKAMAWHKEARYPSAREFAQDLRRFQTGQLVGAHEYSRLMLLGRWVRRHQAAVAVAVVFLLLLAVLGVLGVRRIVRERDLADARSNELILAQGRSSLERDPTATLAWLKTYPQEAGNWLAALELAYDAWSRGVARHVLQGDPGQFCYGSFSPNGKLYACSSPDKTLRLWSMANGEIVRSSNFKKEVRVVRFSPDGQRVAFAEPGSSRFELWDLTTGQTSTQPGQDGQILDLLFSRDGQVLLPVTTGRQLNLWWLSTGKNQVIEGFEGSGDSARISPDGRWVAFAGHEQTVGIYEIATGRTRSLRGHARRVRVVAWSPTGNLIASAGWDGTVRLWTKEGLARQVLTGHEGRIGSLEFSPDNRWLASAGEDGTVHLWDLATGKGKVVESHHGGVDALAFSPDGQILASAGEDALVWLHNLVTEESRTYAGHRAAIFQLAFSSDGRLLASSSDDKTTRIWPVLPERSRPLRGHELGIDSLAFSPDGRHMATASRDGTVRVWNVDRGDIEWVLDGHGDQIPRVLFSPDGRRLASGCWDQKVRWWDLKDGTLHTLRGHKDDVRDVAFSPSGKLLASAATDGTILLWDLDTDRSKTLSGHQGPVRVVAFSPDGRWLASAGDDRIVRLWPVGGGDGPRLLEGHEGGVLRVAFSRDGRYLVSGGRDRTVRLWELATGSHRVLGHHAGQVWVALFTLDDKQVISGGDDGQIWLWAAGTNGARQLAARLGQVRDLALSPDGTLLASGSPDGSLHLWKLPGGISKSVYQLGTPVQDIAFSPDGRYFAAAGKNRIARLWSVERDASLPSEPQTLRAWIIANTTAAIEPGAQPITPDSARAISQAHEPR